MGGTRGVTGGGHLGEGVYELAEACSGHQVLGKHSGDLERVQISCVHHFTGHLSLIITSTLKTRSLPLYRWEGCVRTNTN